MDWLQILLEEKQNFEIAHLKGESYDLSKLREAATNLYESAPNTFPFIVNKGDFELMSSIAEAMPKHI